MNEFIGTGALLRLALRRERFALLGWVGLLAVMVVGTAARYMRMLPTPAAREDLAQAIRGNAALLAFTGQVPDTSIGGLTVVKAGDMLYSLIGLMAILMVVRHTRGEEEAGRRELIGSGVVGRCAPLVAALIVPCAAALVIGLLGALGLVALGQEPVGAFAFASAIAAAGWVFAAVAALTAQWSERARTAVALAAGALATGYVLRFVADGSGQLWLRWLSPQGWSHLVQPFGDERWWMLAVPVAVAALLAGLALRTAARRDLGAGLFPSRPGPAHGAGLTGPLALAWRLQRGALLAWTAGLGLAGLLLGGIIGVVPEVLARNGPTAGEFFRRYAGDPSASITDVFLWLIALTIGYVVALYPMLAILQLRREEAQGRAEVVLATGVTRARWLAGHLLFAAVGPALVLTAGGLGLGLTYGLGVGDVAGALPRVLAGAWIQLPAVWVLGGVAMLAFGAAPRQAVAIVWVVFLFINVFGEVVGPAFGLDYWVADQAVPFHHLPQILSGGAFTAAPLLALVAVAATLTAAGALQFVRRDLT
ncbi:ABC transporter permease [Nannocystis radixulma]|uniref:ABC-2 type transport system permease protein n=1 Tax=Nannocystis radixulma TaxID=2995305 RepID=A0ABT5BLV4_9BACT|nr:hypothetical protein [Nannocystis radixulma]MDC0673987.1 hypothetical protein [Nannocystis radixulma]